VWVLAIAAVFFATGCIAQNELGLHSGYFWPSAIEKNPKRVRNPIVKTDAYWIQKDVVAEEQFPGPTPDDLKSSTADYILGPGDLLEVTVFELMAPGQPYVTRERVSQSGQITFPYLGAVSAAGLSTRGLEEKLADMLEPDYIRNPQVTVFVSEYRNMNVSVLNGVYRPGLYPMSKQDMTLLELVAMSGSIIQLTEDYGYVIRKYKPDEADLLMLESGLVPKEGTGKGEGAAPPAEKVAAPEKGAAPAEKAVPEAAKPAPEKAAPAPGAPGAAPAPAEKEKPAASAPAPKVAPEADREAREILEKMAEGQMPPVSKIEAAEAAVEKAPAAAKPAGAEAKTPPAAAKAEPGQVAAALAKDEKELGHWIWSDGKWVEVKSAEAPVPATAAKPPKAAETAKVAETAKAPEAVKPPEAAPPAGGTAVAKAGEQAGPEGARLKLEEKLRRLGIVQGSGQLRRIIRFDVTALQAGDPTQNVVLRPDDVVTIPSPPVGDFYMAGEVARPGVYSLTGRKITLLQAVAAAGGTTAVAVPWRTEVVRRIAEGEEEIIYVDLNKIARGEVPDFYIHPEDIIRIGTDQGAIFNAVLRNAFRATYGLGAVYDTNFADFYPWSAVRHAIF